MNLDEFTRQLGSDPHAREPETRAARGEGPEFERAEKAARDFERRLETALLAPADPALAENLLEIPGRGSLRRPRWLAVAASVALVAGALAVTWFQARPPQAVEAYVAQHLAEDGDSVMRHAAGPVGDAEIASVLASLGVSAGEGLSRRLRLIKFCPTPGGRGAHMVVDSGAGPVHLIYMPNTPVDDGRAFATGNLHARLVALPAGGAVIIGAAARPLERVDRWVRESLAPVPARA